MDSRRRNVQNGGAPDTRCLMKSNDSRWFWILTFLLALVASTAVAAVVAAAMLLWSPHRHPRRAIDCLRDKCAWPIGTALPIVIASLRWQTADCPTLHDRLLRALWQSTCHVTGLGPTLPALLAQQSCQYGKMPPRCHFTLLPPVAKRRLDIDGLLDRRSLHLSPSASSHRRFQPV